MATQTADGTNVDSNEIYFFSLVTFRVEGQLFRVNRAPFEESAVFLSKVNLPPVRSLTDGHEWLEVPVIDINGVKKKDFLALLKVLIPHGLSSKKLGEPIGLSDDEWMSVVALAGEWDFPEALKLAKDKLKEKATDSMPAGRATGDCASDNRVMAKAVRLSNPQVSGGLTLKVNQVVEVLEYGTSSYITNWKVKTSDGVIGLAYGPILFPLKQKYQYDAKVQVVLDSRLHWGECGQFYAGLGHIIEVDRSLVDWNCIPARWYGVEGFVFSSYVKLIKD